VAALGTIGTGDSVSDGSNAAAPAGGTSGITATANVVLPVSVQLRAYFGSFTTQVPTAQLFVVPRTPKIFLSRKP
jgi:hypothetical protein